MKWYISISSLKFIYFPLMFFHFFHAYVIIIMIIIVFVIIIFIQHPYYVCLMYILPRVAVYWPGYLKNWCLLWSSTLSSLSLTPWPRTTTNACARPSVLPQRKSKSSQGTSVNHEKCFVCSFDIIYSWEDFSVTLLNVRLSQY